MSALYDTKSWRDYRAEVLNDCAECYLAGLAGECYGSLHVHHNTPLSEGGEAFPRGNGEVTVLCARHHALVHAWRKRKEAQRKTCPHNHRYKWAREQCERRLNAA